MTFNSKILLEDLKIHAFHGVLPQEKILGNDFIINVEIHADLQLAAQSDRLEDTINYALVNDIIHTEMAIPSQLLEHVLSRIILNLKHKFPEITLLKIKLTKTNPPMKGEMKGVSVEISQTF